MNNKPHISIVSPVYGCSSCLHELYRKLKKEIPAITNNYEIILINDASPDNSWDIIKELAQKDPQVIAIRLSRNFGQHYAITAGLEKSRGDWVVVMDCDLQDQPKEIIKLYKKANEGYDLVLGKRHKRKDTFLKKLFSKLFYKIMSFLTEVEQDAEVANFGIYKRKVIEAVCSMKDVVRYFPTMVKWVGFKSASIHIEHGERYKGETTYSFGKLMQMALFIMFAFSDKPLRLTIKLGLTVSIMSLAFAVYNLIRYLNGQIVVTGWTSLIVSIWFLSGLIIFVLGIVGLYIGKTYEKSKQRPFYIIDEAVNLTNK